MHLSSEAQQWICIIFYNTTLAIGFNERVTTGYIITMAMLELILNIAGVRVVHGVMEFVLRWAVFFQFNGDGNTVSNQACASAGEVADSEQSDCVLQR